MTTTISLFKTSHTRRSEAICVYDFYANIRLSTPTKICLLVSHKCFFHDNIKATDLSFLHTFLFLNEEILFNYLMNLGHASFRWSLIFISVHFIQETEEKKHYMAGSYWCHFLGMNLWRGIDSYVSRLSFITGYLSCRFVSCAKMFSRFVGRWSTWFLFKSLKRKPNNSN